MAEFRKKYPIAPMLILNTCGLWSVEPVICPGITIIRCGLRSSFTISKARTSQQNQYSMCAMAGELLKLSLVLSSCKKRTDTKVNNILVLVMYLEVCFMVFIDPTNCITVSVYINRHLGDYT